MIEIIKIEMYKLYKGKKYIPIFISLLISLIITFIATKYLPIPVKEKGFQLYVTALFEINEGLFFPIIFLAIMIPALVSEFTEGTIKILVNSKFSKEEGIIGKFLGTSIFFFIMTYLLVCTYLLIVYLYQGGNNLWIGYTEVSLYAYIIRILFALLMLTISLMCFGALAYLISIIFKSQVLSILINVVFIIFVQFIPFPDWVHNYIFITNRGTVDVLYAEGIGEAFALLLKNISINTFTMLSIIFLSLVIFKRQDI